MDIEKHYYDIEDMLGYLIRGLQARWINAVSTFIEKAYKSNDIAKYNLYRTKFEEMADDVEEGLFEPTLERDIFVAYSSQDMEKVNELVRVLESENELSCFVAARNLRHGSGAVENYREAIYTAIGNCKAVVFVSSESSRRLRCEAKSELDYIKANLPEMWRIELLAENYVGKSIERNFISFFDGLEYCTSPQQVADRYIDKLLAEENAEAELIAKKQAEAEEEKRRFEEETRRKLEAEFAAKMQAEAEARRKAEAEAAEARRKAEAEAAEARRKAEAEAEAKRKAEAEAKRRAEAEAKRKAEAEAEAKRKAEAERISKEKAEAEPDAQRFEIKDGELKKYRGTAADVVVPDGVTSIGNGAFDCCDRLKSVTLPNGLKSIKSVAFQWCKNLERINIPQGVQSIWFDAFLHCRNLTSITIPNSVKSVYSNAFNGCTGLKTIYCQSAQKPKGWYDDWLGNCTAEVVWGYKSAIEQKSAASEKPKTVYVDEKVPFQRQREKAAKSASAHPEFLIDNGVLLEYSGEDENVIIPDGVTSIGKAAFVWGIDTLKSVSIPKSVTSISDGAFDFCTALQSIKIPAGVIFIGEGAFDGCDGLQTIYCETAQKPVGWDKDWLGNCKAKVVWGYTDTKKDEPKELFAKLTIEEGVLTKYEGDATNVVIPNDVRVIGAHAFQKCTTLKSITIPAGVKSIGNYAFCDCKGLADITIPSGVTAINEGTFSTCESLKSVTLSNSVTSIGKDAFFLCGSLENISITDNVNSIGSKAFYGCGGLKSITIPSSVGTIEESVFSLCDNLQTIYCEAAQKPAGWHNNWLGVCSAKVIWGYKGAREPEKGGDGGYEAMLNKYWNNFWSGDVIGGVGGQKKEETNSAAALPASPLSDFEIENGVLKKYKGSDKNVVIPSSVTSIGEKAFNKCEKLVSITIPEGVKTIGAHAFDSCAGLESINIPNNIDEIGNYAFYDCTSLTSIAFPNKDAYIGINAFTGCEKLANVKIPNGFTFINDSLFAHCESLTSITLPDSITFIGTEAFKFSGLTSIVIPDSVLLIEKEAFSVCRNLKTIYCKAKRKPFRWNRHWLDYCKAEVVWGYKG